MGDAVSCATTFTVNLCSGGSTIAMLNRDDEPWCGSARSTAANSTDHENIPALAGAVRVSSVQYKAVVPGHGPSPRTPLASTAPAPSQTAIGMPVRSKPAADFAPTLMANGRPVTTGDGIAHTARLVSCGRIRTGTRNRPAPWCQSLLLCAPQERHQTCSPTWIGALSGTGRAAAMSAAPSLASLVPLPCPPPQAGEGGVGERGAGGSAVAVALSGAITSIAIPERSHPAGHDTRTFSTNSAPTATSAGPSAAMTVACGEVPTLMCAVQC